MPTELGWRHITFILNGERVTGFAKDTPPVDFPGIDLLEEDWGPDGTLHVMSTGRKGGELTIKLLPTSNFCGKFLRWHAQIQNDEILDFEGSYSDARLNYSTLLRGGKLKTCPPAIVPGQMFEVMMLFEELIPQADNFIVDSPPGNLPA